MLDFFRVTSSCIMHMMISDLIFQKEALLCFFHEVIMYHLKITPLKAHSKKKSIFIKFYTICGLALRFKIFTGEVQGTTVGTRAEQKLSPHTEPE